MFKDSLLQELDKGIVTSSVSQVFIDFLSQIEGWKVKCKNLHWSAPSLDIHMKLCKFYEELDKFEESLAEGFMGILGKIQPNAIKCIMSDALNAYTFISEVKIGLGKFCKSLPEDDCMYKGILGKCGEFSHTINRFDYLIHLCDVSPY